MYFFLVLAIFAAFGFKTTRSTDAFISLQDETLAFAPKEFYVSAVRDDRDDRTSVAALWPVGAGITKVYLNFKTGAAENVSAFITRNLAADKSLRMVQISIKKLRVDETAAGGDIVKGQGTIRLAFDYIRGADDTVGLIGYTACISYNRPASRFQDPEPVLRHLIENGISYFNTWINKEADGNIKLAKGVALSFADYTGDKATDSVFYSSKRPLRWSDFTTGFKSRKYDAEVFPVMGYDEETQVMKGILKVHIVMKTYLSKESALVKDGAENAYTLNHEQRHFDIAKIAAERFKKRLQQTALPISNYDGPINVYYLDAYREMHHMQEQYDVETAHGTNAASQAAWNELIDKELSLE